MVSIVNDSNIMQVNKKKKITFSSTSYLRMKSENALKFIRQSSMKKVRRSFLPDKFSL